MTGYRERLEYELNVDREDGLCRLFSHRVPTLSASAKAHGHPGRAGARLRRRAPSWPTACTSRTSTRCSTASIFERFLNPERVSHARYRHGLRASTRRGEVIDYVRGKYGDGPRGPDRDVRYHGRARRHPRRGPRRSNMTYAEVDAVAKLGARAGRLHMTLDEALRSLARQLRTISTRRDARVKKLIDTARRRSRACPATPRRTRRASSSRKSAGVRLCAARAQRRVDRLRSYVMTTLEELGLLKMDFLRPAQPDGARRRRADGPAAASRTLTSRGCRRTTRRRLPCSSRARRTGVFQLESTGMTGVCVGLQPAVASRTSPRLSPSTARARWSLSRGSSKTSHDPKLRDLQAARRSSRSSP